MIIIDREPWPLYVAITSLLSIVLWLFNRKISIHDVNSLWWGTFLVAIILLAFYSNALYVCSKKHDYIKILEPKAKKYDELTQNAGLTPDKKGISASGETNGYQPKHARPTTITPD